MNQTQADYRSYLFTVRIWAEALGDGQVEWRDQAQHALSGETRYFRQWSALVEYMLALLPQPSK